MEQYTDLSGNPIELTFDPEEFRPAGHVLIVPLWQGKIVFTHHKIRGIELPGGKIERGETALAAAVRELHEETGASLKSIALIGQYVLQMDGVSIVKSIYAGEVEELLPLPAETDTHGAILFDELPDVQNDPRFSPYMKDAVFERTMRQLGLMAD
ncbi:NUDIX domain-containing protein [Brevibacillus migulae]|uniref:NUDIX domain-containing protein n=1 Tax=Brevibacillus migulae TaxID=1644114 RepID=UPI00106E7BFB|nr:NUDIX domain-containing protein [Brevibacillus migulae]